MSRLKSVTTLIVSGTEFNRTSLDMVVDDLPLLERIDISCTKVHQHFSAPKVTNLLIQHELIAFSGDRLLSPPPHQTSPQAPRRPRCQDKPGTKLDFFPYTSSILVLQG